MLKKGMIILSALGLYCLQCVAAEPWITQQRIKRMEDIRKALGAPRPYFWIFTSFAVMLIVAMVVYVRGFDAFKVEAQKQDDLRSHPYGATQENPEALHSSECQPQALHDVSQSGACPAPFSDMPNQISREVQDEQ